MQKIITTCDHCGKELNVTDDYYNREIDNFVDYYKVDLCSECFHELNDIVLKYCNKKENGF